MKQIFSTPIVILKTRRPISYWLGRCLLYVVLLCGVVVLCAPLSWMIMTSLKEQGEVFATGSSFPKRLCGTITPNCSRCALRPLYLQYADL